MIPLSMTLSDLWPGHDIFWNRISEKRCVLKTRRYYYYYYYCNYYYCARRKIPKTWNGTMFCDLDCRSLNASRGFVSISWASCLTLMKVADVRRGHSKKKLFERRSRFDIRNSRVLHRPSQAALFQTRGKKKTE